VTTIAVSTVIAAASSDPSLAEQLGPYVVSGLVALLGVWLGKWWERSTETRSWLRDRHAYTRLTAALTEIKDQSARATA
jgi:hypothetical protein